MYQSLGIFILIMPYFGTLINIYRVVTKKEKQNCNSDNSYSPSKQRTSPNSNRCYTDLQASTIQKFQCTML